MLSKYPVRLWLMWSLSERQEAWLKSVFRVSCLYIHIPVCFCCCTGGQCERMQVACSSQHDLQDWLDLLTKHTHTPVAPTHKTQSVCHTVRMHTHSSLILVYCTRSTDLTNPPPPPAALSPHHSLQTLRVSWGEHRTRLPHPTSPLVLWQQPNVGASGAAKHPQTLEPELPPPCASAPALGCSMPEGGADFTKFQNKQNASMMSYLLREQMHR